MQVERSAPSQIVVSSTGETVLIVDDSKAQRQLLSRSLKNWGYNTVEANSGREALKICKCRKISLIISDWMMPGMSGIDFCRAYRTLVDAHEGYFILLTAQTEHEALAQGLDSGADDFLSKPVSSTELLARLRAGERILNAQRALSSKNMELSATLERLTDAYLAIDRDLKEAKSFQETLVPERHFKYNSLDISLMFRPSGHVGGDMVGYFPVSDGEIGVFAMDVSGHGVSSALMTARIASYFSSGAPERNIALTTTSDGYEMVSPAVVCRRLNALLHDDAGSDHYLTMVLAHLSADTGKVRLCLAGHPSPAIVRGAGDIELHDAFGMPIGLVEDAEFENSEINLEAGDRLLLYSDGITECPDRTGRLWDEDGLISAIKLNRDSSGLKFLDGLLCAVEQHRGEENFPDDLSAALIEKS